MECWCAGDVGPTARGTTKDVAHSEFSGRGIAFYGRGRVVQAVTALALWMAC